MKTATLAGMNNGFGRGLSRTRIGLACWLPALFLLATTATVKAGTYGDFTYAINLTYTITITRYTGLGGKVVIPSSIDHKPVTSIGDGAFCSCSGLTDVTLPDSVISIGVDAFLSCTSLTSVTLPDSVTSIGDGAFCSCSGLTSVTLGEGVTSIGGAAFMWCTSLTSLTIPASVTRIGNHAFCKCTSLTSVTIPSGISSIEVGVFNWCTSLTSITIPNSVTNIGSGAFAECTSLTSITIPDSVINIEEEMFWNCYSLTNVTIGTGVTRIGYYAFCDCTNLTRVTIPNGVTNIEEATFEDCYSLTNVTIGSGVRSIGYAAFASCSNLPSVTIPDSVTSIGESAFGSCSSLTSIMIPNSVTSISTSVFDHCTSLTNVTIGSGVTSIGDWGFAFCTNLIGVYFWGNAPSLGLNVFYVDDQATVYYLAGTTGWGPTFGGRPTALWITANAPTITVQPQSLTKNEGESASFTVAASGTAPLTYQWQKNSTNIGSANSATHTIASVASGDAGNYRCLVVNAAGTATSAVAVLTVNTTPPPVVGPTIKANGLAGTVLVYYPNPVSITVEMDADIYAGTEVDWWVVAYAHSGEWYYLDNAMQWTLFNGDLAFCRPVYQGALFYLSATTVLDRYQLSRGTYDFWFAVDYPMDGILDPNGQILVDQVTVVVQ